MRVLYERCAAIDVGNAVVAVAVRLPGDGPDGRVTHKKAFKTFYGVLREAARWLTSLGVTHVAMEATGIYSMPVYHAGRPCSGQSRGRCGGCRNGGDQRG